MAKIIGEIDGAKATSDDLPEISEQSPGHFVVKAGNEVSEIFLTDSGLLSDGNSIDGIEVSVETDKERILRERFSGNADNDKAGKTTKGMILKAPMPGMVKAISVSVGDKVQKNSQILVLEAMKMENSISAGFIGSVSKIHVEVGTSVEKNMPLVDFTQA